MALDILATAIRFKKISWILDADVSRYFDRVNHDWMLRFLEHRIADRRMLALIRKWLQAGVLEGGMWAASEEGTPQGSSISPLLANVYLHPEKTRLIRVGVLAGERPRHSIFWD
jgi:retron-type reverse transcriptase